MTYEQTLMEMEEKGKIIGREQGRAEGRIEGREEGLVEGREEGRVEAIKKLMENANLSAEKAMEMLGIEKEEFPKYLKLL